jgi:hypothetical protein
MANNHGENIQQFVRFEILMALYVKIIVFWVMVPCISSLTGVHRLLEEYEEKSTMKV